MTLKTSICLNMIVKNESHIIESTLSNLLEKISIDYWVICDTGSTDDTKEIIIDFFKRRNIPGELLDHDWQNFAYNRTLAIQAAHGKADYVLIFDADDRIEGDFKLEKHLTADQYLFKFGPEFIYYRPLLVKNSLNWIWKSVIHEFLWLPNEAPYTTSMVEGNYHVISGRTGSRNLDPEKYLKDALLLERAYLKEPELATRYAFYCANSYRDAGMPQKAIKWYKERIKLGGWKEEIACSYEYMGNCYLGLGDLVKAFSTFMEGYFYHPQRAECLSKAVEICRNTKQYMLAKGLIETGKLIKFPEEDLLFLQQFAYTYTFYYEDSIVSFYIKDYRSAIESTLKVLQCLDTPNHIKRQVILNLQYYSSDILVKLSIKTLTNLFYKCNEFIQIAYYEEDVDVQKVYLDIWNILFNLVRPNLTKRNYPSNLNNKENPKVFLSITTCKRLDLFKETINSLLNHWMDFNKIDYWFCVDDLSSHKDMLEMTTNYPWIDFYVKTSEEKGHRASMNVIWNKLNELKPEYWIHLEDDFIFFEKANYVQDGIEALESLSFENVKQILFNKHYAELIEDLNINEPVINLQDRIVIHQHQEQGGDKKPYFNCDYWPHYSFRPSIIKVSSVLELGNFDSPNNFFEMDYANKWNSAGFKSGFFNKITNVHIGKPTNNRESKISTDVKNAYALNNMPQF